MQNYLDNLETIYNEAKPYLDRTGTGRYRMFGGDQFCGIETYDLRAGVPIVTTRQIFLRLLIQELLGFIHGANTVTGLNGKFWEKWGVTEKDIDQEVAISIQDFEAHEGRACTDEERQKLTEALKTPLMTKYLDSIGPMYGVLWRRFPRVGMSVPWWFEGYDDIPSDVIAPLKEQFLREVFLSNGTVENNEENWKKFAIATYLGSGYDQLAMVLKGLKTKPYSSRHRVTALHPDLVGSEADSPQQNVLNGYGALAPCHGLFHFVVTDDDQDQKLLNCFMYLNSSDYPLGRPFNIAQYGLLTMLIAHCVDMKPGLLTVASGDTHIYFNQREQVREQIRRTPRPSPQLVMKTDKKDLFALTEQDFEIVNYTYDPRIDYPASK